MENSVRLNKFIASNGYSSRRKIDELIEQGRVTVNKNTVVELGFRIDPSKDKVAVDGEYIRTSVKKIYIMLNKPKGVVTTVSDDKHRTTVIDLVKIKDKIFPVGRLDYNTTGLLLLTNDGELANKLMHPKSEIYKTYFVKLSKPLEEKHRLKLTGGIPLEDKKTAPCLIRYPKKNNNYQDLYISIYEGRNRQVRKMFEFYGYFVRELERTEYAGLKLGDLKEGQWKKLDVEQVRRLQQIAENAESGSASLPYVPKTEKKRDYKKYKERDDLALRKKHQSGKSKKLEKFKKDKSVDKTERYSKPGVKPGKKDSKWGFKDKLKTEKESRLGFSKIDKESDRKDGKKKFGKHKERDDDNDNKKSYKKFNTKAGKTDGKKNFKKFDRKDLKSSFKKKFR
ncbi:MAG TPA: pseudouridine synthase [Ignavibacteria bacterium]|nr:pseudouridine synthase [Ignavibacteria bacterium]HMR39858.1 pseudouridine synthase [Ignavibacteria bacterium]